MGARERLERLQKAARGDLPVVVCKVCGEEHRVRSDAQIELLSLEWYAHHHNGELPPGTPSDVRWLWNHPHGGLSVVIKATGEPIAGTRFAAMAREREHLEDYDDEDLL